MEEIVVNALIQALFFLLPAWRIYKKAGLQPTLSLTVVIQNLRGNYMFNNIACFQMECANCGGKVKWA